jgi:hypothetical protein
MVTMAVLSAPAMAQSYYWDPAWLGNTAAPTSPTSTDTDDNFPVMQSFDEDGSFGNDCDWEQGWTWDPDEQEWVPVWVCD